MEEAAEIDGVGYPVIINGDGAEGIRQGATYFGNAMYQYDRFHIARKMHRALGHNEIALGKASEALRENDIGSLAIIVTEAMLACNDDEQKEKLKAFIDLLIEDQEYIVDYRVRLRTTGFEVPAEWRGLGAAESNVNKFKNRTAKRGRAWSPEGLEAILTTLTRLFKGTLQENISRTLDDLEEWVLDKVTAGAGQITKRTQSSFTGAKAGSLPATRHGTQGFSKLFNRLNFVNLP